jgi:hypothetical protein
MEPKKEEELQDLYKCMLLVSLQRIGIRNIRLCLSTPSVCLLSFPEPEKRCEQRGQNPLVHSFIVEDNPLNAPLIPSQNMCILKKKIR